MQIAAGVLIGIAVVSLTFVAFVAAREDHGPTARHYANLALPLGLLPAIAALALAGPRTALASGILVLLLQIVTGVVESHVAGRVAEQRKESD